MKQFLTVLLLTSVFCLSSCGISQTVTSTLTDEIITTETENQTVAEEFSEQSQTVLTESSESELQTEQEKTDMIKFTVGNNSFLAKLEDNPSANELRELLQSGSVAMSASNYGGFEKVCSLGTRLTSNDVQTTTQAGDIMLYSGSQIVIFYGSNSWAYTRLAKVADEDVSRLKDILSGGETEVVIELATEELR